MVPSAPDLLVLAASNGENLKLAQRFVAAAEQRQKRADLLDLTQLDLPLFTPRAERQERSPTLIKLEQQLQQAPRWVICAPEYNGSIPPVLSNAIA
ncbi:MAG: NADPH-dependent oxidoreductase, partial [Cyanobium sp. MED843]